MMTTVPASLQGKFRSAYPTGRSRPIVTYVLLGFLAFIAIGYQLRYTYDEIDGLAHYSPSPRPPFFMKGDPLAVFTIQKEAADAGLKLGDRVTTLNGEAITGVNTVYRTINNAKPGSILVAGAVRAGRRVDVAIRLQAEKLGRNRFLQAMLAIILGIAMPWCSISLGLYVASVRPRDPLAWVVLGLLLTFSNLINLDASTWGTWVRIPAEIYHVSCSQIWPLFMFLFGFYFPARPAWDLKLPWIKWSTISVSLSVAILNTIVLVGILENLGRFGSSMAALEPFQAPETFLIFGLVTAGITLLAFKTFGRSTSLDARRRLRLLFAGLMVSLTPILIVSLWRSVSRGSMEDVPDYVMIPALLLLLLFPLTLAYVIVVDRAMDVRVAIRQGLQYAFARTGLVLLRVFLSMAAIAAIYLIAERSRGNAPLIMLVCGLALAAAFPVNLGLKRLGLWIDKRFFRDAYDAELVLSELSERVRTIRETQPLVEMVCMRISSALHLSRISVLLERDGHFRTCHATGFPEQPRVDFPNDSAVIAHLRHSEEPPRVYFEDDSSWLYRTPGLDDRQRSQLAYLGAELLLPLSTREKLLGFIAIGQKRSEEPYTKSDIRILSSVASQTGLALENAELTTAIASEMAQRERMAREVEIAREVQERLFPQSFPPVQGLDYWGMCRTALGVGGDYYDFLTLPGGKFGFALGDVAGKGIAAALLMASLQAILRGEAARGGDDLALMITNLNGRVFESSSTNRYATFFYGQYDPATRHLDFVNAGHNPPILLRRVETDFSVITLEATGTVVGLLSSSRYDQSSVQLNPGDYLILFTDGISEAMNGDDEEWGEERLTEVIRACAKSALLANETARRALSAADAFVSGAKQHDDMTIMVLRAV